MTDLLDALTIDDLRDQDKELAELVGIEAFKRLVENYGGGSRLYIPKLDMVVIPLRNTFILREYNGYNALELAAKYNLTERHIHELVKEKACEIRRQPIDGQLTLLESH